MYAPPESESLALATAASQGLERHMLCWLCEDGWRDVLRAAQPQHRIALKLWQDQDWPAVVRRLVDTLTPEKIQRLRQHVELEADARRRGDKRAVIRLSGEFHTLLAEMAGNSALARSMRELCMLTCLTIFLYDAPTAQSCRDDEHQMIIDAVAKRDRARAEKIMLDHLDHIESSLQLDHSNGEADLEAIFRG